MGSGGDITALIAAVRALHFGAAIVLFGQFVFLWAVAPERQAPAGFARVAGYGAALLMASAIAWLGLEASAMSGLPMAEALDPGTLGVVVTQTLFGRVWIARIALAAALALVVLMLRRPRRRLQVWGAVLSALVLATIAGTGHALGSKGVDRSVHLCADALHLLAAGAWLGALLPLIGMLHRFTGALAPAMQATRRFSTLGVASMAAILLSGIINAFYTLPDVAALTQSLYGQMLLAKVSLFLLIVLLAAINRAVLMPRLAYASTDGAGGAAALRRLKRNAIVECLLGFAIIVIVGKLGITMPAAHNH